MTTFIRAVAVIFIVAAVPALAQDGKVAIDPSKQPTSTMNDQVPTMKRDAEAVKKAGPDSELPLPADKAVGEAVPSMKPGDPVSGPPNQALPSAAQSNKTE